jgi:cobalt-zinc-cadmium efflux system outer membrane protein
VRRDGRVRFRAVLSVLLLVCASHRARAGEEPAPPPPDIPKHLTLDEAVDIFQARGFDLLLADAAAAGARGDLRAAQAFPNPLLAASGGHSFTFDPSSCVGCSATAVNANISDQGLLMDLLVGKRRLKIDVAQQALAAAELSRADAQRTLVGLVKQQYTQAVLARLLLEVAQETAKSQSATFNLVDTRLRSGDASEADAARAETAKLEADQAVDVATQQVETARAQLAFLLAVRDALPTFEVDDRLPPAHTPSSVESNSQDSLAALAREHRADLAAADAQVRSAEAGVALARRQRVPDVAVIGAYQQEGHGNNAIQPPTASLGVSLPLPILYRNQGEIAKAEATLSAQRVQHDKLDAQVVNDVRTAWAALTSAQARVARMEGPLLKRARQARDLVDYQYQKGAVSLFERLEAERTFVSVSTEYDQAEADFWTALYQLEQAVGTELVP